jgi:hypothetical protein
MPQTLPTTADQNVEYEDYYESSLAQPLGTSDTDIFPETLPASAMGFLVIDPTGSQPETIFYNQKGANYVRCPSAIDGQGRGVFNTTPGSYGNGIKIGMYSIAAFFEGIVQGKFMRDGFIQARHFSASINPNNWVGLGQTLVFGGNVGQKVSTYLVSGDITPQLPRGTNLQLPRVAATNTHCADFEADASQYAAVSSPSGVDFTGPFSIEAWISPESYKSGVIFGRDSGSGSGWSFELSSEGNLVCFWRNGSGFTSANTYTIVPLGQKTHVAVTVSSLSTPSLTFYVNGVEQPLTVTSTAATTLIQGGDLTIGERSGGTYFDGKIAEVRGWSIERTKQQILDNMNKRITGSETNLFAYFRLDGDFNDLSPNGNNLTAHGAVTATTLDNPWSATEYGKVIDATFSGGSTTISVYTGNKYVAPNEDIVNAAYSYTRTPPGMDASEDTWTIETTYKNTTDILLNSPTSDTWYNLEGVNIKTPIGDWKLSYHTVEGADFASAVQIQNVVTLSSSSIETIPSLTVYTTAASVSVLFAPATADKTVSNTATTLTSYALLAKVIGSGASHIRFSMSSPTIIRARCPYL